MTSTRIHHSVWYRSKPATESTSSDPFTRERGRLVVEADGLRFEGPKTQLTLRGIEAVEFGVYGTMTNPSVHVRYRDGDEPRSAWFTDGAWAGYGGMFGGTRRLAEALDPAGATFDDESAGKMQRRMAYIIGAIVLFFLVRALRSALG